MAILSWSIPILAESALLALMFLGIGSSAAVFWHASAGIALPLWWHEVAAPDSADHKIPRFNPGNAGRAMQRTSMATSELPSHALVKVPFSPQAPYGAWGQPYQDACEETSVVMAMAWARGVEALPPSRADAEIRHLVAYEQYYFGYDRDTAIRETAKLLTHAYEYRRVRTASAITMADIKAELALGNLVLLPTAGTLLKNPYYLNAPPYHMVVVTGYDDIAQEFIVNDPGTRNGENYRYPYQTLWNAVHDWTGDAATILNGEKAMIVVVAPEPI